MIELFSYTLSLQQLGLLVVAAMLIGMGKTGVNGAGMLAIPIIAIIFGARASTGILLPILIFADLFGVHHYHQHANWEHLKRLLPFALIGTIFGTATGESISDEFFRELMAIIIFVSLAIMVWQQRRRKEASVEAQAPNPIWFIAIIGIIAGFTSMVGNLAGSVMALYLLAMGFPKNPFIGTAAWFFLAINLLKLPFHIVIWETITVNSALIGTLFIPAIALGAIIGIQLIKHVPEKVFRCFIITMTGVAAIVMVM